MLRGAFRSIEHSHQFESSEGGTIMRDRFAYEAPLGILGRLAEVLVLDRYLRRFLLERNGVLKATAESEAWRRYLPDS